MSSVSHDGVTEVLRAVQEMITESKAEAEQAAADKVAWTPHEQG